MKIATAQELSRGLRDLAHDVKQRLWIASPFVGGWRATKCLIDTGWQTNPAVSVRLLTDIDNEGWLNPRTIREIASRGEIKHLRGLHAKVYIIDNSVLIASANLTRMAFESRHEIGAFLNDSESSSVIDVFKQWWKKAKEPPTGWPDKLRTSRRPRSHSEEPGKGHLEKLNPLPELPTPCEEDEMRQKTSFTQEGTARPPLPSPAEFHSLFEKANRFFICNTDRKHGKEAELQMRLRGYAAAWEDFSFPTRMDQVESGHAILFYANRAGIVGIGRAKSACEKLNPGTPDRLSEGAQTREWRIPLDWLIWAEEDGGAFRDWPSSPPTFFEVNAKKYRERRNAVRRHFGRLLRISES